MEWLQSPQNQDDLSLSAVCVMRICVARKDDPDFCPVNVCFKCLINK